MRDEDAEIEHGQPCPTCGAEVLGSDVVDLPIVAFKREMYDACFFETNELPSPWRGNTLIAYHEQLREVGQ